MVDSNDNPDPVGDATQRLASALQTAQGAMTTFAIYGQRGDSTGRAGSKGHRDGERGYYRGSAEQRAVGDEARWAVSNDELARVGLPPVDDATVQRLLDQESRAEAAQPARVRPLLAADAGLDAIGPGSALTEEQQNQVRRAFHIVPDPDDVAAKVEALRGEDATRAAADEAAEAGAMWATNDDNPATVPSIGGTNPRAARTARVADAIGDASAQAGEEALDPDDPLHPPGDILPDPDRDPMRINAWETPDTPLAGEDFDHHH